MLTQLSACARTARSQVETGCGPRVTAALAGAVAVAVARPTVAVASAMIAPIRRLLFIHSSGGCRTPGHADVAPGKPDTMGNPPRWSAFTARFGLSLPFPYKMVRWRSAEKT